MTTENKPATPGREQSPLLGWLILAIGVAAVLGIAYFLQP